MSAMPTAVMPTAAESRPVPAALAPTVVRPRQAGLRVIPAAGQRTRSGQRARTAGGRARPTGVRACSTALRATPATAVLGAAPATAVLIIPQGRPSRPAADSRSLRLTSRGRVVLAVGAAAAASLFGLAAAGSAQAADHGTPSGAAGHSMARILVQPGQTLWSIALQADPQADPRLVVRQIMAVNALSGGSVTAGQRLLVPRT